MAKPIVAPAGRAAGRGATIGRAFTAFFLGATAFVLWVASAWATTTTHQVALSSLSLTAVAWGGAVLITGRREPHQSLFLLGPWMLAYGGMTFGLATITAWLVPESVSAEVRLHSFHPAHSLVIMGFIAFVAGYLSTPKTGFHRLLDRSLSRVNRWDDGRQASSMRALFSYVLGLSALVLSAILSGTYGYLGNATVTSANDVSWFTTPLSVLDSLRGVAVLILWVIAFSRPEPMRLLLASAVTTVDLVAGLLSGMKEAAVLTLLAVVLAHLYVRRRFPLLALGAVGSGFVLFLSPFVASLRDVVRGDGVLTLEEALPVVISGLFQFGSGSAGGPWEAVTRFRLIDNVAIINQKTPTEIPFQPLGDLFPLVVSGFVPRAIWPTKPVRIEGLIFYHEYYGGSTYSSSALTIPGSLFMYGGPVVLLIGMLIFGALTRSLDDGMKAYENRSGLLLLLALFPAFVKMEVSATTMLASLPVVGIGWVLAAWLIFYRRKRQRKQRPVAQGERAPRAEIGLRNFEPNPSHD